MPRSTASRLLAAALLGLAMIGGALLAVKSHAAHRPLARAPRAAHLARTFLAPSTDGGAAEPVATVIPPRDAGPPPPAWPPALLNPTANLRMAWDLAVGRPGAHEILFTFDDGPNPGTTDRLLAMLDRAHYHAVFFVCGWRLEGDEPLRSRARALLRDEYQHGHVIGNHTVHHRNMATLTSGQATYEIGHNADLIQEVIGERPFLFRPPYGSYSVSVHDLTVRRHDELMLWSIDSHDWQMVGNAQAVAMNVIRLIGNMAGGTILLHDTHPWSVAAAQMIFRWIDTENRDRVAHHREPYRVMNPAAYIEGERARIPVLEAQYAAAAEAARHARRHGGAAPESPVEAAPTTMGAAGMGAEIPAPSPSVDAGAPPAVATPRVASEHGADGGTT